MMSWLILPFCLPPASAWNDVFRFTSSKGVALDKLTSHEHDVDGGGVQGRVSFIRIVKLQTNEDRRFVEGS
jgi:hypothetical protein